MARMGVASLVTHGTLKLRWLYLKNELIEWTDFLHGGANSGKQKVISMIFSWARSKMGMHGHLVHETLKSIWVYGLSWHSFLHADCDAINFY